MFPATSCPNVVVATAKVRIFKQITTEFGDVIDAVRLLLLPQRYEFSSKSQLLLAVPQHHTGCCCYRKGTNFQANHNPTATCSWEWVVVVATAKVRIFKQITTAGSPYSSLVGLLLLPQRYEFSSKSQPNAVTSLVELVVVATAKVRIFKQITTHFDIYTRTVMLLLLPQRYEFSSKSQQGYDSPASLSVVVAIAKVRIFKQIKTSLSNCSR